MTGQPQQRFIRAAARILDHQPEQKTAQHVDRQRAIREIEAEQPDGPQRDLQLAPSLYPLTEQAGMLIRFAQDCRISYGAGVQAIESWIIDPLRPRT
mgnify:CR=1 FL=1